MHCQMKNLLIPAFLLMTATLVVSQNSRADSLEQLLKAGDNARQRLELIAQLVDAYRSTDLNKALSFAREELALAEDLGEGKEFATAQMTLGEALSSLSQYDSAMYYLSEAKLGFEALGEGENEASVVFKMGAIKSNQTDYDGSMQYYFDAMKIWESIDNQAGVAKVYNGIADLLYMQHNYQKSIEYCEKAITLQKKLKLPGDLADTYLNLAYDYLMTGDHDGALESVNNALAYHGKAQSDPLKISKAYNARGNVYKFMERYDEAIADYEHNLQLAQAAKYKRAIMVSHANLGHVYKLKNEFHKALPHTLKAIQMMQDTKDTRNLWENYMHASDIYAGLGDYKKANQYAWLYSEEVEQQYEEQIDQLEDELLTKYEAGQSGATIALQKQKISQQRKIQFLSFGLLALLVVIFGLAYRGYQLKQKTNRLLTKINESLKKKNQENELLLKEIHHRVKNNLQIISSLLSLQSAQINDTAVLDAVQESQNRVQSMGLIHQKLYQGENLAAVEMKDYFENLGENMLDSFGSLAANVDIVCSMDKLELDVDTAIPIGLIVNELLTNSVKYAFPDDRRGRINISLSKTEDEALCLRVSDDGVGVKNVPARIGKGSGFGNQLVNLLTRQLDGTMIKESVQGVTTIIKFKLNKAA